MEFLSRISQLINRLNDQVGKAVSWLTLLLVLLMVYDVFTRKIFNFTQAWIMELEWHFFALIFLFGAGYALRHDRHVRVDLFYAEFSARDKALVNMLGSLLFLIPWCILIIYFSTSYTITSYNINETSPDPGGLPARYLIKAAIPLGLLLLLLQGIAQLLTSYQVWKTSEEQ